MARPGFPLTIMEFQERFASEEPCRAYLFECRWPDGFRCPSCDGREAGEMHRRRLVWQCRSCGHQTSVTAGTVMHKTHTPLRLWFWAAYLVATHHPGISAKQFLLTASSWSGGVPRATRAGRTGPGSPPIARPRRSLPS